jgi:hypothetical protein
MGCCFSSPEPSGAAAEEQTTAPQPSKREAPTKNYSKPKWKHDQPLSGAKLQVGSGRLLPALQDQQLGLASAQGRLVQSWEVTE